MSVEVAPRAPENAQAARTRPPRVLVATPVVESKLYAWREWVEALASQRTELLWDLLVVDNTDHPSPGYVEWLARWCKGLPDSQGRHRGPFGGRPARLARFGQDVDGQVFRNPLTKVAVAEQLAWGKFRSWSSYDYMLSLESDVLMPPDAMQQLYDAQLPWAAAWMTSRNIKNPDVGYPGKPEDVIQFPLLFHGLDLEAWSTLKDYDTLRELGYMEPPQADPFPCVVTHLGCTLIRGDVIRSVPFRLTNAGGDVCYSWDCAAAGYQPMCVPAVSCEHVAEHERPKFNPLEVR